MEEVTTRAFLDELQKIAVSASWVGKQVASAAEKVSPQRLSSFVGKAHEGVGRAMSRGGASIEDAMKRMKNIDKYETARETGRSALSSMRNRLAQTAAQARPAPVQIV